MFDWMNKSEYTEMGGYFGAFWVTIELFVLSGIGALIWGTILAAMRVSPVPVMRWFGTAYINIVRNTPLTVIITGSSLVLNLTLGWTLGAISAEGIGFRLAVLGFIAYTGCFVCEAIRSGINTVPVGQAEAARALGLPFTQVLGLIVLPQAFRSVIGPLASVLIALLKNTTVAATIATIESAGLMNLMVEHDSDKTLLIFVLFAAGFVVLALPLGLLLGWVAKKAAVKR